MTIPIVMTSKMIVDATTVRHMELRPILTSPVETTRPTLEMETLAQVTTTIVHTFTTPTLVSPMIIPATTIATL